MSREHIIEYIVNRMSPVDLISALEPWITTEELMERLSDIIDNNYSDAFSEELEDYYS